MSRLTRTAWWALPIAVALTGSAAVGATVDRVAVANERALPELSPPKASDAAGAQGSRGIVLGGRALVTGAPPAATTTTGPGAGAGPLAAGQGATSSEPEGGPADADNMGTVPSEVPPPTVVQVEPDDDGDEDDRDQPRRDRAGNPPHGQEQPEAPSGDGGD